MMKKGDKVFVNFPTGGEWLCTYLRHYAFDAYEVITDEGEKWVVPVGAVRPANPEIEEGNRVYVQWPRSNGPYDVAYSNQEHRKAAREGYLPIRVPAIGGGSYYYEVPKQICELTDDDA